MEAVKRYFGDFVFSARVMPTMTAVLPLIIILLYNKIAVNSWSEASIPFALAIILISFFSCIVREWGKDYESKMFEKLGGKPTTIILRFSDNKIDDVSKAKYHQWLNNNLAAVSLPMSLTEEKADLTSDEKYISAMTFLRNYANSNRDRFPRVYQELKKYNFWRNLYGCKILATVSYTILLLRELVVIDSFNLKELFITPFPKYVVSIGLLIWICLFCSIVTQKTVERNAFDYAKALLEIIENLFQDKCDIKIDNKNEI